MSKKCVHSLKSSYVYILHTHVTCIGTGCLGIGEIYLVNVTRYSSVSRIEALRLDVTAM